MSDLNPLYTFGIFVVYPGKETEFIRTWDDFARWTSANQPGAGDAHLLQDVETPTRFLSFGDWESDQAIQSWRATPEFDDFAARVKELCESFEPRRLSEVASSGTG